MDRWPWLAVLLLFLFVGVGSTAEPVRCGIDRDGFRLSVELELPHLPSDQASVLEAMALSSIAEYPAGTPLSEWVTTYHRQKAHQLARLKAKMPDAAVVDGWYRETRITTTWNNGGVISLHGEHHGFTGGAHGWLNHTVQVFDAATLTPLTLDDLIAPADQLAFSVMLTDRWRQAAGLPSDAKPSKHGLFIDELPPALPLITANGIEVIYQPYEVGPWSTGTVRVTLTREQARPFLRRNPWP